MGHLARMQTLPLPLPLWPVRPKFAVQFWSTNRFIALLLFSRFHLCRVRNKKWQELIPLVNPVWSEIVVPFSSGSWLWTMTGRFGILESTLVLRLHHSRSTRNDTTIYLGHSITLYMECFVFTGRLLFALHKLHLMVFTFRRNWKQINAW